MDNRKRLILAASHFRKAKEEMTYAWLHFDTIGGFQETMDEIKQSVGDLSSAIEKIEEHILG